MSGVSHSILPKTGLPGLMENWRSDLLSGFLVFLIALPLCLGVSMASGFPPSAGIITAIVGGLLVSRISGSFVTINGPAAGLIVVVLAAVQTLGEGDAMAGYRYTLAAIVVSSVLQILMGFFKIGRFSAFFPVSVVHGMLAAIGIIVMSKQFHVMLGVIPKEGSVFANIAQISQSLAHPNTQIAIIGFSCMIVLIIWSILKDTKLAMIPAPIVVVLLGILMGYSYDLANEHLYVLPTAEFVAHHGATIGPKFLVSISESFLSGIFFPDFSKLFSIEFWSAVISISLVGSLETLLSAVAVDKLDPYKRHSDLDRDLMAVGIGNFVAAMIGGLPMIAEIVRSSANVNNGAKTAWANFFHGALMLAFVVLFPSLINSIPLAALAALLVYTGFRLASPNEFLRVMGVGKEQLLIFVVTIVGVLATDLLIGVAIGIAAKLAMHIAQGVWLKNLFKIHFSIERPDNNTIVVKIVGSVLFSNYLPLIKAFAGLENGKTVIIDLSDSYLIDHTVMEFMHDFMSKYENRGGKCRQVGQALEKFSDHALAARIMTVDDRM